MKLYEYAWFKEKSLNNFIKKNVAWKDEREIVKIRKKIYKTFTAAYYCTFENPFFKENMFSINTGTGCSCFDSGYLDKDNNRLFLCFEQNLDEKKNHIVGIYKENNEWFRDKMVNIPQHIQKSCLLENVELVNKNYVGTYLSCDSEEHLRERIYDGERFPKFVRDLGESKIFECIENTLDNADRKAENNILFFDNAFYTNSLTQTSQNNISYFIPIKFPLMNGEEYTMALVGSRYIARDIKRGKEERYLDIHTIYRLEDAIESIKFTHEPILEEFQMKTLLKNKEIEEKFLNEDINDLRKIIDDEEEMG